MDSKVILEVYIKPNAKKTQLLWDKDISKFIAFVKSPAQKGKANKEVLFLIKEYFKAEEVNLLKGITSKTKTFEIEGAREHLGELQQKQFKR